MNKIELSKDKRVNELELLSAPKKIKIEVSREKCNDILLEMVDFTGMATCKPLHKVLPVIKVTRPIHKLRFIMNDFSTKPITIMLSY